MPIYKEIKGKWFEMRYIATNGEDAMKQGYSYESGNKGAIKGSKWKDNKGIKRVVKLKKVKQLPS